MSRRYYKFNVKEAAVALVTADDPASTTGVVNGPWYRWQGIQNGGYEITQQLEKLYADGILAAQEPTGVEDIPIDLAFGKNAPDIEALVSGCAAWDTPDGTTFVVTEDIGNAYVSLKMRTDRTGTNGADVVITIPKLYIATLSRKGEQRKFHENSIKASAAFTDSTIEVIKDGVAVQKRVAVIEEFRVASAPLVQVDSVAPTVVNPSSNLTGSAGAAYSTTVRFSEEMNLATVNKYTIRMKNAAGDLVAASVVPTTSGTYAYKDFTITTAANVTAQTYTLEILVQCKDRYGNALATQITRNVVIS